jgi:recombinational DNA repair protein (RecF pathway)
MHEVVTTALVLARYPQGEQDARVTLLTREQGKVNATVISGKKVTSKLSPHLMEGSLVSVRLIEQHGMRIGDALTIKGGQRSVIECLILDRIIPEEQQDDSLFALVAAATLSWKQVLKILGWDPDEGHCYRCEARAEAFLVATQDLVCGAHLPIHARKLGEVIEW